MAILYVRSTDGNNADDGSTWALAKATLAGAFTAAAAGDTIYVSDNHAETQASAMTLTSPGTAASPCRVICADDAAEPPTATATTATISTTGASNIAFAGYAYCYGIQFLAGSGASAGSLAFTSTSPWWWRIESGGLVVNNTNSASGVGYGTTGGNADDWLLELINTPITFGAATQGIIPRGAFRWTNSSLAGTGPTALFKPAAAVAGMAFVRGVDLSTVGSGKALVAHAAISGDYTFVNCKLGSSVTLTSGSAAGQGGLVCQLINCDSGDTNYRYQKNVYQGDIYSESTIVRTGGATDGTTPISRKMVSSANAKFFAPLESHDFVFWNETTGSTVTVTFETVTDNVTLTDAEAWVEVEYLGTSGFPVASTITDRATNILTTPANQTTSTETWTTTGLTTPVKQALSVTFTPQEKGPIIARVMLAKASTTMYVCPEILTTANRSYMLPGGNYINEPASGGGAGGLIINPGMSGGLRG